MTTPPAPPSRRVVQAEARAWLDANVAESASSVITSLPDISEMPALDLEAWRAWFVNTVRHVIRWLPEDGVAIYYQSDIRNNGVWIDKGYLVLRGADDEGASVLWHKIVCRRSPGALTFGRPSYSHMIAVSRQPRGAQKKASADVLPDAGFMPWSRAMGAEACRVACSYLLNETTSRTIVDPFCGRGTVLAVANAMGMDAIGIDLSAKRCRAARALVVASDRGSSTNISVKRDHIMIGAARFDAGAFWDAHEVWEERWRDEQDERTKRFLQGLIQIAAGFHKFLVMDGKDAAAHLLGKGLAKLDAAPDEIDMSAFREGIAACRAAIDVGAFDVATIPKLEDALRAQAAIVR